MKRSRFSEEQIIAALKQAEAGVPVAELCRRLGVTKVSGTSLEVERRFSGPVRLESGCKPC